MRWNDVDRIFDRNNKSNNTSLEIKKLNDDIFNLKKSIEALNNQIYDLQKQIENFKK